MNFLVKAILFFLLFLFATMPLIAEKKFLLYGYKLGQSIEPVIKKLGKPAKVHRFPDGFTLYAYQFPEHNLIFETDNTRPDLIWAIQIQGHSNPKHYGLDGIDLGDPVEKMVKKIGKPDKITQAVDEITKKDISTTSYYSYFENGNYSIEVSNGKISSIKMQFNGPAMTDPKDIYILDRLIESAKAKDYYATAHFISSEFEIDWNGKKYKPGCSLLDFLIKENGVNDVFFSRETGIASLLTKNIDRNVMTLDGKGDRGKLRGLIFTVNQNNNKYQFLFFQSFDGWVLRSVSVE